MNTALVELFKHNVWANLRLLDLCAGLSDDQLDAGAPGTYGRVRDTVQHIVSAEENYLHRLLTGQRKQAVSDASEMLELRERVSRSGNGLIRVAERFQPGESFQINRHDGNVYAVPAEVILVQAINHATEHRSQVLTILSQQGIAVPELGAWDYWEDAVHSSGG